MKTNILVIAFIGASIAFGIAVEKQTKPGMAISLAAAATTVVMALAPERKQTA